MKRYFDKDEYGRRLAKLPHWKKVVYGLATCEVMFPHYVLFCRDERIQHDGRAREVLDFVWRSLPFALHENSAQLAAMLTESEARIIELSDDYYESGHAERASELSYAICCLVDLAQLDDTDHVLAILSHSINSISYFIRDRDDITIVRGSEKEAYFDRVYKDPLMKGEIARMQSYLAELEALTMEPASAVGRLHDRWSNVRESPLGFLLPVS